LRGSLRPGNAGRPALCARASREIGWVWRAAAGCYGPVVWVWTGDTHHRTEPGVGIT